MKKSIIKLALDSLELRLMQDRQKSKREGMFHDVELLNDKLEIVRDHQKELEIVQNYIELY
tara:strand:+ start:2106 stop:2288 length:183 start_codon:yes stop_codon:yes gene_type:complete